MINSISSCLERSLHHPVVLKDERFWRRILIVDDDKDITITFKAGIEESNNHNYADRRIEVQHIIIL
jgi:hypothetical protein